MGAAGRDTPKSLLEVGGIPVIEHQLRLLKRHGIDEVVLCLGHLGDRVLQAVGDGSGFGVRVEAVREEAPLGTAGAVRAVGDRLPDDFVVIYGDVMLDLDLGRLVSCHRARRADATLVVHASEHPADCDLVRVAPDWTVLDVLPKPRPPDATPRNLALAAVWVLSRRVLDFVPPGVALDFGRDIFPGLAARGRVHAYPTAEYLRDVGTPEKLRQADADFRDGRVARRSRSRPRPAVFLDRDGVINRDEGLVHDPAQVRLLPRVPEAIRRLNDSDCLAVVVTNQPVVARNMCSLEELDRIHGRMEALLAKGGARLDAIYACPHHPDGGYEGENAEYKVDCDCRKPRTGLIDLAAADLNIDLAASFIVGDTWRDVEAGRAAGLRTIAIGGASARDGTPPDASFDDLEQAVEHILAAAGAGPGEP
jgi:histidinol-phosphate phosphatase family protein